MKKTNEKRYVVFVSLTGDQQIKCYDLDLNSGTLELRSTSNAHGPAGALYLHPSGKVMLIAHVESTTLASFRLDTSSGRLALINKINTGIDIPAHLITDCTGRFLLTAYYGGGGVTVHRLGDDGTIDEQIQYIDTGEKAHAIHAVDEDRFVFVPHVCPTNKTSQFRFDCKSGLLSPNDLAELSPPDDQTGPRHICFRPQGDVAYIVNEQGNTVTAHRYDAKTGTLKIFQNISTLPPNYTEGGATAHVEVHPNGKWVYASNRGHDSIAAYRIGKAGKLTLVEIIPSLGKGPQNLAVTPDGRHLICANMPSNNVVIFQIDGKSGKLSVSGDPIEIPSPSCIMIVP